jgi:ribosomal protein S18 acetylase RimI-like enzyme
MTMTIRPVGVEHASEVHRLMRLACEEYRGRLVPPSEALTETIDDVRAAIKSGGAFLAFAGEVAVGSARYRLFPDHAYAERIAVLPAHRGSGTDVALMAAFEEAVQTLGVPEARVGVKASLPSNLRFYENLGYRALASRPYPTGTDFEITLSKRLVA